MLTTEQITEALSQSGIISTAHQMEQFLLYLDLVWQYRKIFGTTGTKNKEDILVRHFFDCLSIFKYFSLKPQQTSGIRRILDVGTGAGFPGLLIAIFLKGKDVWVLDSKEKAAGFINIAVHELNLENVKLLRGRAEELAYNVAYRESFDLVVARAVAGVPVLAELLIPYCKTGGKVIMFKSKKISRELQEGEGIIRALGAEVEQVMEVKIPFLDEYRVLLIIDKVSHTSYKYPRKYGKIIKIREDS